MEFTKAESNMNDLVADHQQYQDATVEDERMRRMVLKLFKFGPVQSVCISECSDTGKEKLYSRGLTVQFKNEEESGAFHYYVFKQWKDINDGGGALVIDYDQNGVVSDSLQAIRKHKFVDILDNPGSADLSAYVDFASIRHSAEEASGDVSVHGPITQSQFLGSLGIN